MLEGLPFVQGGLILKFNKNPLIYNVSYFNLGDLELRLGDKPTKAPRGDGTGREIDERNLKIINLTTFILKGYKIGETKTTAQTTSDLLQNIRHHKVLSKHQKWQHCCISSTCAH